MRGNSEARNDLRKTETQDAASADDHEVDLSSLISCIPDVLWQFDVDSAGKHIRSYISPVADRMLGLPEGSIQNKFEKYFEYVYIYDLPLVQRLFFDVLLTPDRE